MITLHDIAKKHQTDKASLGYTIIYEELLASKRFQAVNMLEIGVFRGASMRTWFDYFHQGNIYGIDGGSSASCGISDEEILHYNETEGLHTVIGNQFFEADMLKAMETFETTFDFIIDNGQHFQETQQSSFGFLWPYLKPGGIYIIEDMCTHFNMLNGSKWGQSESDDLNDSTISMLNRYINGRGVSSPYFFLNVDIGKIEGNISGATVIYPAIQARGELIGPMNPLSPILGSSAVGVIWKNVA